MSARRVKERWTVDFWFEHASGKRERVRKAAPVNTRRGAEEFERQPRVEMLSPTVAEKVVHFADYADEFESVFVKANLKYATQVTYESTIPYHLVPEFGSMLLGEISGQRVERFKAKLMGAETAAKTVRNTLGVLSRMLHVAKDWGYLTEVPAIRLPKVPDDADLPPRRHGLEGEGARPHHADEAEARSLSPRRQAARIPGGAVAITSSVRQLLHGPEQNLLVLRHRARWLRGVGVDRHRSPREAHTPRPMTLLLCPKASRGLGLCRVHLHVLLGDTRAEGATRHYPEVGIMAFQAVQQLLGHARNPAADPRRSGPRRGLGARAGAHPRGHRHPAARRRTRQGSSGRSGRRPWSPEPELPRPGAHPTWPDAADRSATHPGPLRRPRRARQDGARRVRTLYLALDMGLF